jgi:hypothetical protein
MRNIVLCLAMLLVASEAHAQQAVCGKPQPGPVRLKGNNRVILEYDPHGLPPGTDGNIFRDALVLSGLNWNQKCVPRAGDPGYGNPESARRPTLVTSTPAMTGPVHPGEAKVPVKYERGHADKPSPCPTTANPNQQCFPMGEAIPEGENGWTLAIYGESGPADNEGEPTQNTFAVIAANGGGLAQLFMHEIGHVLGLDHDNCESNTLMNDDFHGVISGESTFPGNGHCAKLEEMYVPPDPTDDLSGLDDAERCALLDAYCPVIPTVWPKQRSTCIWIPETFLAYYFVREVQIVEVDYFCNFGDIFVLLGEGGPGNPMPENYKSPVLAVTPFETMPNGDLKVSGWTWGRTDELRQLLFLVDGEVASMRSLAMGLPDPGPCEAGFDPEYCVADTGFEAVIRTDGLAPGNHQLQMIATDHNDFPMPVPFQRQFVVEVATLNQPPVAVDDLQVASIGVGGPVPELLNPLDNDFDPDGDVVKLAPNPIVTPPSQGTVERVSDYQLRYIPFPHQTGPEVFTYKIVDSFGNTATAEIEVMVMEIIIPEP